MESKGKKVLTASIGTLANSVGGMQITGGVFAPYIASYLYFANPGLSLSYVFSMHSIIIGVNVFGPHIHCKWIRVIGVWGIAAAMLACSFITSPLLFAVVYSLPVGMGSGFIATGTVWPCVELFPNSKGKVTGLLYAGFAGGPAVWSLVLYALVNPENVKPSVSVQTGSEHQTLFPQIIGERLPLSLQVLSGIFFCIGLLSYFLIADRKVENPPDKPHSGLLQALKSKEFWIIYLGCTSGFLYWLNFIGLFRGYGLKGLQDDSVVQLVTTIASVCAMVSRFIWPALLDWLGYKVTLLSILTCNLLCSIGMIWANQYAVLFGVVVSGSFFASGGLLPTMLATFAEVFGTQLAPMLFSFASSYLTLCGLFFMLSYFLIHLFGYIFLWLFFAGAMVLGLIVTLTYTAPYKKLESEDESVELEQV